MEDFHEEELYSTQESRLVGEVEESVRPVSFGGYLVFLVQLSHIFSPTAPRKLDSNSQPPLQLGCCTNLMYYYRTLIQK